MKLTQSRCPAACSAWTSMDTGHESLVFAAIYRHAIGTARQYKLKRAISANGHPRMSRDRAAKIPWPKKRGLARSAKRMSCKRWLRQGKTNFPKNEETDNLWVPLPIERALCHDES